MTGATEIPEASPADQPGIVRLTDWLGVADEARSYVHVHAPQPDAFGLRRSACPTCQKRTYFLWRHTPWYGVDDTCLRCGEEWQDGERSERPLAPRWRERRKQRARQLFRCLKAGRRPTVEPAIKAGIEALQRALNATPNVEVRRL